MVRDGEWEERRGREGEERINIHIVHPLETQSLRLWDKEPDEEEHREAARAEEKVGTVTRFPHVTIPEPEILSVRSQKHHIDKGGKNSHVRDGLRNHEVK